VIFKEGTGENKVQLVIKNHVSADIGDYFGHSLASGDIDGDGTDEILVGAPCYSSKLENDLGRVYIFKIEKVRSEIQLYYHSWKK
jgi:FG-GAP repeat